MVQIEGDPDAPHSRGRLCPKGSATLQLTTGSSREQHVLYRPPHATEWQRLDLETAMDMVADRVVATRREGWEWERDDRRVRRCMSIAALGGATLDNEENYLIKKLLTALGIIQIENQARVCHSSTVVGLGTSFGRGASSTLPGDLQNSDLIVLEGSNMAEAHPVAFQWVVEAKARGATVIHVDPHYSRTSALADMFVPLRAGTDIAFLGGDHQPRPQHRVGLPRVRPRTTPTRRRSSARSSRTPAPTACSPASTPSSAAMTRSSWQYEGAFVAAAAGQRDQEGNLASQGPGGEGQRRDDAAGQPDARPDPPASALRVADPQAPLRRLHAGDGGAGVRRPAELFAKVCELFVDNSGRERTTAFVHGVGWTQHTIGSQYIRAASILQLLLGNMGRPGGGVMAMRGHASIQGSSDIPTLFDTLPGYIPMPHAHAHEDLDEFIAGDAPDKGFWGNMRDYTVSLLKAWWGEAATADNDFCFDYLPRLTGSHSTYDTVMEQIAGTVKGYFLFGQNPAVGSANTRHAAARDVQARLARRARLLADRERDLVEGRPRDRVRARCAPRTSRPRCSSSRRPRTPRRTARSPTPSGWCSGTTRRWSRATTSAATCGSPTTSASGSASGWPARDDEMDRPVLDLDLGLPDRGRARRAQRRGGAGRDQRLGRRRRDALGLHASCADDGSTSCGCWIYCGCYADGVNQTARRKPAREQNWTGGEWAWAWPANRRILYNRASADPRGQAVERAQGARLVGRRAAQVDRPRHPRLRGRQAARLPPRRRRHGPDGDSPATTRSSCRPTAAAGCIAPAGVADGPLPTHYEPQDSPVRNLLHRQQRNPARQVYEHENNRYHPDPGEPGRGRLPVSSSRPTG